MVYHSHIYCHLGVNPNTTFQTQVRDRQSTWDLLILVTICSYCGWKKSCITSNNEINHLSSSARFRNHPQYVWKFSVEKRVRCNLLSDSPQAPIARVCFLGQCFGGIWKQCTTMPKVSIEFGFGRKYIYIHMQDTHYFTLYTLLLNVYIYTLLSYTYTYIYIYTLLLYLLLLIHIHIYIYIHNKLNIIMIIIVIMIVIIILIVK